MLTMVHDKTTTFSCIDLYGMTDGSSWLLIHPGQREKQQLAQEASLSPRSSSLSTILHFLHEISNKQCPN